ncbi:ABC transporter permease [Ruminococcus sp. NK3A76]|uniref:ABC transporter permease n=1 Tax=Ruminococcus sp. NK3A76 TaxID=877411 RepID=UPI00048E6F53|nr:ABC transporter permease [Ruminococcus sp. NK3A76]
MKFMILFKKELKEMLTLTTLMTMIFTVVAMVMAGSAMSGAVEEAQEASGEITICNLDDTEFTKAVLSFLENPAGGEKNDVKYVDVKGDDYASELDRLDIKNVVIIPEGFSKSIENNEQATLLYITKMNSLSTMSNVSTGSSNAVSLINAAVKSAFYSSKVNSGALLDKEVTMLEAPVTVEETTIVGDKSEKVSAALVVSATQMSNMFLPIMVFVLVIYSSQMILNAVANEKLDKTLETLLSAPVSRLSVLSAKMLAAGVVAGLNAIVYMFGMNKMTSSLSNMTSESVDNLDEILKNLGLTMSVGDYVLVGIQMFLTILITLSVSLVLGVLVKDSKSAQSYIMPISLLAMIPYMLSMFVDISTLSPALKYVVYAIPFTHTFMATQNVMLGKMSLFWGGFAYQAVLLVVCMGFAVKVFTSDRIFTMTLSFGKKKQKEASNED